MGTRSLTIVNDGEEEVVVMYRQFDGYPSGHGQELANFLGTRKIVNGIGLDRNVFNGAGCLAASLFAEFKEDLGGIYAKPAGTRNRGEEFIYEIDCPSRNQIGFRDEDGRLPTVTVYGYGERLFQGTATELAEFCEREA